MTMLQTASATIHRYKRYSAYRDSGVEWLGEIPAHWEVKRLKRVFRVVNGSTPQSAEPQYWDGHIPWVTPEDLGDLLGPEIQNTRRCITEAGYRSCGTTLVPSGSLVLSTRAPIGHLAIAGDDLCTNQGCRSLVFRGGQARAYFFYQLLAARPELESLGQGSTFKELARNILEDIVLAEPRDVEQRAIATFLDRETARIDALVAKKEQLIGLLQEKRTALMARAVTKGLDPNVPMKDSGVEWLGVIPSHWDVVPLKRLLTRCDYGISEGLAGTGEVRVLTMAHIQDGEVILPESGSVAEVDDEFLLDQHDLLFNRTNSRELVGKVGVFRGSRKDRVSFASYLVRMTAREGISPTYLNFLLNSSGVLGLARSMAMLSVNQANLNPTRYTQIQVPRPVRGEQEAISAFLDRETARIDALVAKVRDAIDCLKELRTALISAAVTGKIDVRGEVAA